MDKSIHEAVDKVMEEGLEDVGDLIDTIKSQYGIEAAMAVAEVCSFAKMGMGISGALAMGRMVMGQYIEDAKENESVLMYESITHGTLRSLNRMVGDMLSTFAHVLFAGKPKEWLENEGVAFIKMSSEAVSRTVKTIDRSLSEGTKLMNKKNKDGDEEA